MTLEDTNQEIPSDDPPANSAPEGNAPSNDPPANSAPEAGEGKGPTLGGESEGDDEGDGSPAYWPDDWRDRIAGEDEKLQKRLARFASPETLARKLVEQDKLISSGKLKRGLPEDASDSEVAAYRKEIGIPETGDIDSYGVKFKEGVELSDADKAEFNTIIGFLHEKNATPDMVQGLVDKYVAMQEEAVQAEYDAAVEKTEEYRNSLREEFGRDYKKLVSIGDTYLNQHLGDNAPKLTGLTLVDGTKLGDHPDFVRFIVNAGQATLGDEALITSTSDLGGKSVEEAYKEALALRDTDPKAYHSKEHQEKLVKLASARMSKS